MHTLKEIPGNIVINITLTETGYADETEKSIFKIESYFSKYVKKKRVKFKRVRPMYLYKHSEMLFNEYHTV